MRGPRGGTARIGVHDGPPGGTPGSWSAGLPREARPDAIRQKDARGPGDGARPRWPGRRECACAAGSRASVHDGGCSAGKCACPCSRSDLPVTTGTDGHGEPRFGQGVPGFVPEPRSPIRAKIGGTERRTTPISRRSDMPAQESGDCTRVRSDVRSRTTGVGLSRRIASSGQLQAAARARLVRGTGCHTPILAEPPGLACEPLHDLVRLPLCDARPAGGRTGRGGALTSVAGVRQPQGGTPRRTAVPSYTSCGQLCGDLTRAGDPGVRPHRRRDIAAPEHSGNSPRDHDRGLRERGEGS